MKSSIQKLLSALFVAFIFSTAFAAPAKAVWTLTTIDNTARPVGGYSSLALDSVDAIHVSYYDDRNGDLKYATNATGAWVVSAIDSAGTVGKYTALALDSADAVHISYHDWTNGDLKYATNSGGAWVTSTIDTAGRPGADTDIAIDSAGFVHIVYSDITTGNLRYITNESGAWVNATLGNTGYGNSIALDSNDAVHISSISYPVLKYITNSSGAWATTAVDAANTPNGPATSIAIDSAGNVHIAYKGRPTSLKFANNTSGIWTTNTLDPSTGDLNVSFFISPTDDLYIGYGEGSTGTINLTTDETGIWLGGVVANGYTPSVGMDSAGYLYLSFMDSNYFLVVATDQ